MVALRPFFSAARISGKPGAFWIDRVRSFNPPIASATLLSMLQPTAKS